MRRTRRSAYDRWWIVAYLTLAACGQQAERGAQGSPADLTFLLDGCEELGVDGSCELTAQRSLTLWAELAPAATLTVLADDQKLVFQQRTVRGGEQVKVTIPATRHLLRVGHGARWFRLALAEPRAVPQLDAARARMAAGALDEAKGMLAALFADADLALAARALDLAGRIERQRGNKQAALSLLQRASAHAHSAGLRRLAAKARLASAFLYEYHLYAPERALEALSGVDPALDVESAWTVYHRALIAFLRGDARTALTLCAEARERAERLGHARMLLTVGELELMQLAELGRLEEARALGVGLAESAEDDGCERARLLANLGWAELASPHGDAAVAEQSSARAVEGYSRDCVDIPKRQNALINLALAHWKRSAYREAHLRLAEALTMGELEGWVQAWALELTARLALSEGRPREALAIYEQQRARTESSSTVSSAFRAELGMGEALVALGQLRDAADAFERAELGLEADARRVPLAEGRDIFAGDRDASARQLVEVWLRLGRPAQALHAARRARARGLRTLTFRSQLARAPTAQRAALETLLADYRSAREDMLADDRAAWTLPLAELPAFRSARQGQARRAQATLEQAVHAFGADAAWQPTPLQPGEVLLTYHPLPEGWAAFAQTETGVAVARLASLPALDDHQGMAQALLSPFASVLRTASRVRILPYGELKHVGFHALPFDEGLLIDAVPVVYGVDLGGPPSTARAYAQGSALIVADPTLDLPSAREEGRLIQAALSKVSGLTMLSGAQAERGAVLAQLAKVELFHYAGHAEFEDSGWQSGLKLSASVMLEPGDILALSSVPRRVVLSGCDTSRERGDVPVASLGLAQAFLAHGTEMVVATSRAVPDTVGLAVSRGLVAQGLLELDAARFRAVLAGLRTQPGVGEHWASYRLLVP